MAKAAVPATRTFILTLINGTTRKIEIPASWKLTFGSLVPYIKRDDQPANRYEATRGGDRGGVALRFYEGNKDNLRAVMTDVLSFRESTMKVLEKQTTIQRQGSQKRTAQGLKDVVIEARVTEWNDPDADPTPSMPNEFLQLTDSDD